MNDLKIMGSILVFFGVILLTIYFSAILMVVLDIIVLYVVFIHLDRLHSLKTKIKALLNRHAW